MCVREREREKRVGRRERREELALRGDSPPKEVARRDASNTSPPTGSYTTSIPLPFVLSLQNDPSAARLPSFLRSKTWLAPALGERGAARHMHGSQTRLDRWGQREREREREKERKREREREKERKREREKERKRERLEQ